MLLRRRKLVLGTSRLVPTIMPIMRKVVTVLRTMTGDEQKHNVL